MSANPTGRPLGHAPIMRGTPTGTKTGARLQFAVRLFEDEYEELRDAAKKKGVSVAQAARLFILDGLKETP
jgi:hypothetical protein